VFTIPRAILVLSALVVVAACSSGTREGSSSSSDAAAWTLEVEPVPLPAAAGSFIPQLTSSPAGVIASWTEMAGDTATLKFSERTSSGWSPAATAASGKNWFVSPADAPSVLKLSSGTLVADWFVATRIEIEAYDTLMSYSKDGGRTWAPPFKPNRDKTTTQHGFASVVELPDKGVGVVWLDGRDNENNTTDPEGGVMFLRYTSFDANWKPGPDAAVNRRVCECCQTALAVTSDGVLTAFRDRSDKEIRDIAVSRLDSGKWTDAQVVHADNWEIDSCPVNGPAMSARGRDVAVAWFTGKGDEGHAYAAFSRDAGRTWSTPVRLDERESTGHVDIELLEDGSAAASWVEYADGRQRFTVRRIQPSGPASAPVVIAGSGSGRVTGYPRMARNGDELVFAWTENAKANEESTGQVKTAVARLPR
jgi:hypothetical protein